MKNLIIRREAIRSNFQEKNPGGIMIEHAEEYYTYRGCSTDGLPTRKKLAVVGLSDVAEDLAKKR